MATRQRGGAARGARRRAAPAAAGVDDPRHALARRRRRAGPGGGARATSWPSARSRPAATRRRSSSRSPPPSGPGSAARPRPTWPPRRELADRDGAARPHHGAARAGSGPACAICRARAASRERGRAPLRPGVRRRAEGAAVDRRQPPDPQGGVVVGGGVADVPVEAEAGVGRGHRARPSAGRASVLAITDAAAIAGAAVVASHHPRCAGAGGPEVEAVDQADRRAGAERGERPRQQAQVGAVEAVAVDRGRRPAISTTTCSAWRMIGLGHPLADRRGEALGVVEVAQRAPAARPSGPRGRGRRPPPRAARRGTRGRPRRRPATRRTPKRAVVREEPAPDGRCAPGRRRGAHAPPAGPEARSAASRGCGPSCPPCRAGSTASRG